MKCKVIIVDDEPMSLNLLERYCIKNGNLQVNGKFENALAALDYLLHNETDLLFLDIEMPGLSGFQLLDQLLYMPKVILTTAKTDHAFDAFQYGVTDYLKKHPTAIRVKNKKYSHEKIIQPAGCHCHWHVQLRPIRQRRKNYRKY